MANASQQKLVKDHFAHRFCDNACMTAWIDADGDIPDLFNEEPSHYASCLQCEASLNGNSSSGYGFEVSAAYDDRIQARRLMYRGIIPADENLMIGYRRSATSGKPKDLGAPNTIPDGYKLPTTSTTSTNRAATQKDRPQMSKLDTLKETAIEDAKEVRRRAGAKQALRIGTTLIASGIGSKVTPEAAAGLKMFMESPFGQAIVGLALSSTASLLPEEMRHPEVVALLREIRVGAVTEATDQVAEVVMAPVRDFVAGYLGDMKKLDPQLAAGSAPAPALAADTASVSAESVQTNAAPAPAKPKRERKPNLKGETKGGGVGNSIRVTDIRVNGAQSEGFDS